MGGLWIDGSLRCPGDVGPPFLLSQALGRRFCTGISVHLPVHEWDGIDIPLLPILTPNLAYQFGSDASDRLLLLENIPREAREHAILRPGVRKRVFTFGGIRFGRPSVISNYNFRRVSQNQRVRWHIGDDYAVGADHSAFSDGYPFQDI